MTVGFRAVACETPPASGVVGKEIAPRSTTPRASPQAAMSWRAAKSILSATSSPARMAALFAVIGRMAHGAAFLRRDLRPDRSLRFGRGLSAGNCFGVDG